MRSAMMLGNSNMAVEEQLNSINYKLNGLINMKFT